MSKMISDRDKVLNTLIKCEISLYTALYTPDKAVVPISNVLSLNDGMTKYRAKKALKQLIEEGLVYYTSQGCPAVESYGEYRELICEAGPPINGYALTDKAFRSPEWTSAYSDWNKSMEEWANYHEEVEDEGPD